VSSDLVIESFNAKNRDWQHIVMDGWMDEWMDGWLDGGLDKKHFFFNRF